jgi:opacity protein-like surface antigen
MKRFLSAVAGLTLAAVVAAPASAQSATELRTVRFGVQGGLSMPMGDFGDAANSGYIIGGLVDWRSANLPFGLRFNVDYQSWGSDADVDWSSLSGTADAMFTVPTTGGISPYVLGGVGMYRLDCSAGDFDCEGSNEFGFNLGGGVNFNLGEMGTFAEIRYHNVDEMSFVPIVFGIRF